MANKWNISLFCGLIFLVFSSNTFYQILSNITKLTFNNCPTYELMLISSILFALTLRLSMTHNAKNIDKWRYTYYTWYMFIFVNNPLTYKLINSLFNSYITKYNCGIIFNTLLFIIILRYSMELE